MIRHLAKAALLPPGCFVGLGLVGLGLSLRRPKLGRGLVLAALLLLYAASTRIVAGLLLVAVQSDSAWRPEHGLQGAQAIVLLGGDLHIYAEEYGGPTVGELTLERVRYTAFLYKETGLPILTAGGTLQLGKQSLADLMARALQAEYGVPVQWREGDSRDTLENARFSAELLGQEDIRKVMVVTHAWHMPRAQQSFEKAGLEVVPAPTAFDLGPRWQPNEFLPSAAALQGTSWALHEWVGRLWYRVR